MHRVVRPFPVSWDGLTLVDLHAGDEREFGDMTGGLLAEGYIEAVSAPPVAAPAREPAVEPVSIVVDEPVAPTAPTAKRPYKKRN